MATGTSRPDLDMVGEYDLIEKIAEGGMGSVHKGRHRITGEMVAIKLIAPQMSANATYIQRFEKEYNTAKSLDHPNIVRALEQGISGGRPYLVMEFVDGESLGQKLERDQKLPEAEAIRIITEVAQGLIRAHNQGLIHRDVKPDNIMVTGEGKVKLADLGLVKEIDCDLNLTRTGRGLGTPHFMAPEQFRNAKNATVQCDIYSLGATLYMMVTGEMPFSACAPLDAFLKKINNDLPPPSKLIPTLSERTDWVIRQAMDPNPENRYRSCQEFLDALTGINTRKIPSQTQIDPRQEAWWYLKYTDEEGNPHMVKGTVTGIRRSLKEGRLGDAVNVLASPTKGGNFEPLGRVLPFQDLFQVSPSSGNMKFRTSAPVRSSAAETKPMIPEHGQENPESFTERFFGKPHFRLENRSKDTLEWVKLGTIVAFAIGAGVLLSLLYQN